MGVAYMLVFGKQQEVEVIFRHIVLHQVEDELYVLEKIICTSCLVD